MSRLSVKTRIKTRASIRTQIKTQIKAKTTLVLLVCSLFLSGCLTTLTDDASDPNNPEYNKRASLSDLANNRAEVQLDAFSVNKAARSAKLAEIYQQLLNLEPNPEIRTQVEYRLVQINTDVFENQAFGGEESTNTFEENAKETSPSLTLAQIAKDEQALQKLILSYQGLLQRYPERIENEHIQQTEDK